MTDEEETVEEVTEERPQTIAEALDAINKRIDGVVGENERLRHELASLGTSGNGESGDRADENTAEPSTAKELESTGGESDQGGESEQESEPEYREPDEPPRAVHRWWKNPIGGS